MKKLLVFILLNFSLLAFASDVEGLKKNDSVPTNTVETIDNNKVDLLNSKKEIILVFFRGSWCPYCMSQLKSIESEIMPKLKKNQHLIAISVDKSEVAAKMIRKFNYTFDVISDPKAKLLRAFKIANKIDDDLVKKYKNSYSIDIEGDSGETHHIIAHPAVFILKNGKIKYADVHVNYKERTKNEEILNNLSK